MRASNPAQIPETFGGFISDADFQVLEDALAALLRERTCAMRIAAKVANATGRQVPQVEDFGLTDILRLSRAVSCRELCLCRCNRP